MGVFQINRRNTEKIDEYSVLMSMDAEIEGEETGEELDETEERRIIPNYSDYVVDNTIPHTLYEDFTHKRVDAFQFNNVRYPAREWKDVLMQTCDLLAEIDADKFSKLIDDPIMKGRKISYFSREYIDGRNTRMKDIDVYVWTNLSANSIVKLIRKLLKNSTSKQLTITFISGQIIHLYTKIKTSSYLGAMCQVEYQKS